MSQECLTAKPKYSRRRQRRQWWWYIFIYEKLTSSAALLLSLHEGFYECGMEIFGILGLK